MSQVYPYITQPLVGANAFTQIGEDHSGAQAAILLQLGRQLRGDDEATAARADAALATDKVDVPGAEDAAAFPVPVLTRTPLRVAPSDARDAVKTRFGRSALTAGFDEALRDGAAELYDLASVESAANLFEICLVHPLPLVRIAAAGAYFPISADPKRLIAILAKGVASADDLERKVAATSLARIDPTHPALRKLLKPSGPRPGGKKGETLLLVHGTWASGQAWWQNGGDFHTYVTGRRPDTYGAADRFGWSGDYSDAKRALAAVELEAWVVGKNELGLDLVGHSHGANVVMLATANGMRAGKLVLLSCPVHVDKYFPDFSNCGQVHSVRVRMDLVILADRGGQRFRDPRIQEHVLPIWFDHGASHDPNVWTTHGVPAMVGL